MSEHNNFGAGIGQLLQFAGGLFLIGIIISLIEDGADQIVEFFVRREAERLGFGKVRFPTGESRQAYGDDVDRSDWHPLVMDAECDFATAGSIPIIAQQLVPYPAYWALVKKYNWMRWAYRVLWYLLPIWMGISVLAWDAITQFVRRAGFFWTAVAAALLFFIVRQVARSTEWAKKHIASFEEKRRLRKECKLN
jgi:hypothetical protein